MNCNILLNVATFWTVCSFAYKPFVSSAGSQLYCYSSLILHDVKYFSDIYFLDIFHHIGLVI